MSMMEEVEAYYKSKRISAVDFDCPHYLVCKGRAGREFVEAKEPLIGTCYESHAVPRVLFISADPMRSDCQGKNRTVESVRRMTRSRLEGGNPHWRETCRLALAILRGYDTNLRNAPDKVVQYFAHTNSAKCCSSGRGQGPKARFDNCRAFLPREIQLLLPDVIVTQGKWAEAAMNYALDTDPFREIAREPGPTPSNMKELSIGGAPVLWISTAHPSERTGKYGKELRKLEHWIRAVDAFWRDKPAR